MSSEFQGDERKRTVDDVSKHLKCCQNQRRPEALGKVCAIPDYGAGGNRYIGGMTLKQALTRNVRTCRIKEMHRGGADRSSIERSVMERERRISAIIC